MRYEFVLRMSYHVLPRVMPRTRYARLFRGQGRSERLDYCRKLLGEPPRDDQDDGDPIAPFHTSLFTLPTSFVACAECDRPTDVSEELPPAMTMSMLAAAAWVVTRIKSGVQETFRQSLEFVVAERQQRGSRNPIILGMSSGLTSYEDPIVKWVALWVEQTLHPPPKPSPRGPPVTAAEAKA